MLRPHTTLFAAADDAPTGGGGTSPSPTTAPSAEALKLAEEFAAADPAKMTIAQRIAAAGGILAKGDAHISTLNTRIADHEKSIAAKDKEIAELKDKLEAAEKKVTKLEAEAKEISDAMAKIETEAKELKSKEQDLDKRAEAKSKERLGAIGFPSAKAPAASDKPTAEDSLDDLRARFKAESDPMEKGKLAKQIRGMESKLAA